MKINKQIVTGIFLVAILISFIPLSAAAPTGISESAVLDEARSWIGVKEVHGGNNRSAIDCSHLVYQVYKAVGVKDIEFQTVPNMKKNKHFVTTTSPTPGDVIFWKKDVTQNNRTYWLAAHVGIYIGNGQFIHPNKVVTIESISGVYKDGIPYYVRWESESSDSDLPVAAFSASPTSGTAPLSVSFIDNSIGATSRSWIFGDGDTSAEKEPVHTYSKAGTYLVKLTVSNENGTNSKSATITVSGQPVPLLPKADFNSDPVSGFAPLDVRFIDASKNAASWNWDFGDGATSTEQNPAHTYFSAGNYTVNLKVTNSNGTDSKNATISVSQEQAPLIPVADFNANLTVGYSPLTVQFTDSSQNASAWSWIFGDGAASSEQNPSHIYSTEGIYTVILTVNNANGSASKETTITVQSQNSSDESSNEGDSNGGDSDGGDSDGGDSSGGSSHSGGSSGSKGGGGAGGSPEPQSNVEAKELSQTFIASGLPVKFDFPQEATPVLYISFDSEKTTGKTTTIAEMLKNRSALTADIPDGEVHKYINIWVGSAGFGNSKNIKNSVVSFKAEKSWIQDKNIDRSSIILNRYNDTKWNALPTNLSGEDDKYLYFTAETPGFSPFAITGKIIANEAVNATQSETQPGPKIGSLENNASNAAENKQTSEQTQSQGNKTPGFGIVTCISCLFGIFLYKRRKINR